MTDDIRTIADGDSYLVIYSGGPFDGQTETRVSTDGGYDELIDAYAAVDGVETKLGYRAVSAKQVGDIAHVTYVLDRGDSDPIEDADDRSGGLE
ncbi:oligoribonuclease [Microbacteriaceae bacterium VKM Ac-2854]|nr:oligoribonuclease [Microbacteriaceae bacterium VKM Ac-2854]